MRILVTTLALLLVAFDAAGQTVVFEREDVEYRLELPSARWRAVPRVDVHRHYEFVNGEDRSDGYLRVRKNLVEAGTSPTDLFLRDEASLRLLPGYVRCASCDGEKFSGALSGAVFSYEYTSGGAPMAGRVYYLRVDGRAFYTLHFTWGRRGRDALQAQADSIARSFRLG